MFECLADVVEGDHIRLGFGEGFQVTDDFIISVIGHNVQTSLFTGQSSFPSVFPLFLNDCVLFSHNVAKQSGFLVRCEVWMHLLLNV